MAKRTAKVVGGNSRRRVTLDTWTFFTINFQTPLLYATKFNSAQIREHTQIVCEYSPTSLFMRTSITSVYLTCSKLNFTEKLHPSTICALS